MWPADWNTCATAAVAEVLLEAYARVPAWDDAEADPLGIWDSFYTPYQFTLLLMQSLYESLLGPQEGLRVKPVDVPNIRQQLRSGQDIKLIGLNPHPRHRASQQRLLAIAFYSWESDRRHFLNRRVYPTYFDFLSISHVPQGWGASARMLLDLRSAMANGAAVRNGFHTNVVVDETMPETLPYLAEKRRLKYDSVLVAPVFATASAVKSDDQMLGAWLLFAKNPGLLDDDDKDRVQAFLEGFCDATGTLIEAHNRKLGHPGRLDLAWEALRRRSDSCRIAKLTIASHSASTHDRLFELTRELLRDLSGPEFYAIRSGTDMREPGNEVIYVISRADTASEFRDRLLRLLIDDKFSHAGLSIDVSIRDVPPGERVAFKLDSDGQWHVG
jgi:hypothetical protein